MATYLGAPRFAATQALSTGTMSHFPCHTASGFGGGSMGGGGGAGNSWGNHPNHGGGSGTGSYGGFGTYITSTSTFSAPGGGSGYVGVQIDPSHVERENAKHDGIMEGYWWGLIEGYDLPFLPGNAFAEKARGLVQIMRAPQPQMTIRAIEAQGRRMNPPQWMLDLEEVRQAEMERYYAKKLTHDVPRAQIQRAAAQRQAGLAQNSSIFQTIKNAMGL